MNEINIWATIKAFHRNKKCPRPGIREGIVILFLFFAQLPSGHVKLSKWHNHSWTSVELQLPQLLSKISLWGSGSTILCSKHDPLQQLDEHIWLELPPSITYYLNASLTRSIIAPSFFSIYLFIYFYWSIVNLQCCVSFKWTAKWFSYRCKFLFRLFSTISYYKILSIVPCAIQ